MSTGRHFARPNDEITVAAPAGLHFEAGQGAPAGACGFMSARRAVCAAGLSLALAMSGMTGTAWATYDLPDSAWDTGAPSIDNTGSTDNTGDNGGTVEPAPDNGTDTSGTDTSDDVTPSDGSDTPDYVPTYDETYAGGDTSSYAATADAFTWSDTAVTTDEATTEATDASAEEAAAATVAAPIISGWDESTLTVSGTAAAGVTVRALDASGNVLAEAVAAEDGTFALTLPEGASISDVSIVAVDAEGTVSAAALGSDYVAAQQAAQQAQERKRISAEVASTVASLAANLEADVSGTGVGTGYAQEQASALPIMPYALGAAGGAVLGAAVAVGGVMILRHGRRTNEAADQGASPAMVSSMLGSHAAGATTASMAPVAAPQSVWAATTAPAASAASASSDLGDTDAFLALFGVTTAPAAGAGAVRAPEDDTPRGPQGGTPLPKASDTADFLPVGAQTHTSDFNTADFLLVQDCSSAQDTSGLDCLSYEQVSGDLEAEGDPLAEYGDWRQLALAELTGANDVVSSCDSTLGQTLPASQAEEPTLPVAQYVAPVVGPASTSHVVSTLRARGQLEAVQEALAQAVEAHEAARTATYVPEVQAYQPGELDYTSYGATQASAYQQPVQAPISPAVTATYVPELDPEPRPLYAFDSESEPVYESVLAHTSSYTPVSASQAFPAPSWTPAAATYSGGVSCVVPDLGANDFDDQYGLYASASTSFAGAYGYQAQPAAPVAPALVTSVAPAYGYAPVSPASRFRSTMGAQAQVPAVYGENEQLPTLASETFGADLPTYEPVSAEYISYLVNDEFSHRHDTVSQRAAATSQFHVVQGTVASPYDAASSRAVKHRFA